MFLDLDSERPKLIVPSPQYVNFRFSVKDRIQLYKQNLSEVKPKFDQLQAELTKLDPFGSEERHILAARRAIQIERELRFLEIILVKPALEIDPETKMTAGGYRTLRKSLVNQFVGLSDDEKQIWLSTFLFMTTPDVWAIYDKIKELVNDWSIGQKKGLMITAQSGMGKTSLLDYLVMHNPPYLLEDRTIRPLVRVDVPPPESGKNTFPQRLVAAAGIAPSDNARGDSLFDLAIGLFGVVKTLALLLDEVENFSKRDLRRRFVDLSNATRIPIICATCNPAEFTHGDQQVQGRFGEPYLIKPYTGKKLIQLLSTIDLLLPFSEDSGLGILKIKTGNRKSDESNGPAALIEQWTGGILVDIFRLIIKAASTGIQEDAKKITVDLLRRAAGK